MTALNGTNFDAAIEIKYRKGIEYAVLEKDPFLAQMEKRVSPGKQYHLVGDDAHFGASASFTVAQGQKGATTPFAFAVTRAKLYCHGAIDGETQEETEGGGGVALALDHLLTQKTTEFTHMLSSAAWTGQGGAIGQIATGGVSGTSLTLSNISDHVKLSVGDELEFSTTNTSASTPHSSGATATVTAINRETGVLTSDSNWSTQVSAIAAADYIFKKGNTGAMAAGVVAWVDPAASPGTLFGVTRTTDRNRRAGMRYDASGLDMASALILGRGVYEENVKDDANLLVVGPRRYAQLEMSLEGKAKPVSGNGKTSGGVNIGFNAIMYGDIMIMKSRFCPDRYGLLTNSKGVWKLAATKSGIPHWQTNGSGSKLYPEPNSDADQFRMRGYYQVECHATQKSMLFMWEGS